MSYHLDYESRSRQELTDVGGYRYAECPDARILLAAISHDDDGPYLWVHPDYATPLLASDPRAEKMLREMAASDELIFAHNCQFERAVTMFRGRDDLGLTEPIDPKRWRCTAAMARKAQIPDSLEMAAQTLGLDAQKDNKGKALIKKFSVPRDDGTFLHAEDDPAAFAEFGEYCLQDVRVERELHKRLAPFELSGIALEAFLLDIYLNDRGVPVNVPALKNASRILAECYADANVEFRALTGLNPTQREKVRQWCNARGAALENMQGPTLEAWLEEHGVGSGDAVRAVEMYAHLNFAAAKKVDVMLACVNSDGVVRGTLLWHGAGTGRWCLTGDHEVLTRDGWIRLDAWEGGKIAVWNPSEQVSFQESRPVAFPYEGEMLHYRTGRIDQIATPDHKMGGWCAKTGRYEDRLVGNLRSHFCIPFTGQEQKSGTGNLDELRLLIATQADGYYSPDALKFHFRKKRKTDRLLWLLRRTGIVHTRRTNSDGTEAIEVSRKDLPTYLALFENKTFGPWILRSDARVVFEELELWDGSRCGPNSIQYSTTNKVNADLLQALAHTSGFAASLLLRVREDKPNWSPVHVLNIWLTPKNRHRIVGKPTRTDFSGTVYCAETPTGYFLVRRNGLVWVTGNSGKHIQPQNFKKPSIKDTEIAYRMICDGCSCEDLENLFGNPLEVIASCIRHFIHVPGSEMLDADYNAIECRDSNWLAGEETVLKEFREGKDPYKRMAATIFNRRPEDISNPSRERDLGKCAELGAGFGMGCKKFLDTCHKWGMTFVDEALAERAITGYRDSHPRIVKNWYEHNDAAKAAILQPGRWFNAGAHIAYAVKRLAGMDFLLMRLPSGRTLSYPEPRIEKLTGDKNEGVTHWGKIKGVTWGRCRLYGGKLAENCLSGDTEILTPRGWICLEDLAASDTVFDGVEFVSHGGLLPRGKQETVDLHGIRATSDHHFFGAGGWITAEEARQIPITALWSFSHVQPTQTPVPSAPIAPTSTSGHPPRAHDRYSAAPFRREDRVGSAVRLRELSGENILGYAEEDPILLQELPPVAPSNIRGDDQTRDEPPPSLRGVVLNDPAVCHSAPCGVPQLRGAGDNRVPAMAEQLRGLLERHGLYMGAGVGDRPQEQRRGLHPRELPLGASDRKLPEHSQNPGAWLGLGCREGERGLPQHALLEDSPGSETGGGMQQDPGCIRQVFDIRDCGPRNCFVVRSPYTGVMLLAHNCAQAVAADLMTYGACEARRQGYDLFTLIHDQALSLRGAGQTPDAYAAALATLPPWAHGLPLKAEAKVTPFYKK